MVLNTKSVKKHRFEKKYSTQDVGLIAKTANAHNKPNGIALKTLLQRAYEVYGDVRFKTVCNISVSYLYVVMNTTTFKRIAGTYEKTKPCVVNIGERIKPCPNDMPGFLRVDSVHQGEKNGIKGIYHIDIVDEVTQWQVVICGPEINAKCMTLALNMLIDAFPFEIKEIHSDNGSEYINYDVAKLLTHLLIKLTKNRPRKSEDNALCETKHNIIRKWLGYVFMPKNMHTQLNEYYLVFNEYLNFHRCCLFASKVDAKSKKGKIIKVYKQKNCMTPFTKLKSLPGFEKYLKPGVSVDSLNAIELKYTDYQTA